MNKKYTTEQIEFIRDNVTGRSYKELTELFNKRFGTDLSVSTITATSFRYGFKNGKDTRFNKGWEPTQFKKGHIPFNKGKKGCCAPGSEKGWFKKGNTPVNHRTVGSERIDNKDGYTWVKTAEPNVWRCKHVIVWEKANGPVPKGHALLFADGNKENLTLDNLLLVSRAELAIINKRGLISKNGDLTKIGITIADIHLKIGERRKKAKGNE